MLHTFPYRAFLIPKHLVAVIAAMIACTFLLVCPASAQGSGLPSVQKLSASLVRDSSEPVWTDGMWKIFAYPNESMCDLGRRFNTGEYVTIGFAPSLNRSNLLLRSNYAASLNQGDRVILRISFHSRHSAIENTREFSFEVMSSGSSRWLSALNTYSGFIDDLSRSDEMIISSQSGAHVFKYSLSGSSNAIEKLKLCTSFIASSQISTQDNSPLKSEYVKLLNSDNSIIFEFIKTNGGNRGSYGGLSLSQFISLVPNDTKIQITRHYYYIRAIKMATLILPDDVELVNILNEIGQAKEVNTDLIEEIAMRFERTYRAKYRRWPPIVPVDVERLTARMLNDQIVR